MPICIAGMHRSGTSMIAGLLKGTGVYLGAEGDFVPPADDNPAGFWEHFGFWALNDGLLHHLGAGWDMPDLPDDWASRQDLSPFREGAGHLIERMRTSAEGQAAWGWKDPRNSLTIQFWKTLLPEMRVVVCVRNPLAVACSLRRRNNISLAASGRLWLRYYQNLLENISAQDRVLTLYDSYFADPHAELARVLGELGLPACSPAIAATSDAVDPALHHHQASFEQLLASDYDSEIIDMYVHLCAEVHATGHKQRQGAARASIASPIPAVSPRTDLQRGRFLAESAQREEHIRQLSVENTTLRELLEDTRTQLATQIAAERHGREIQACRLSAIAEEAALAHQLTARARAKYVGLQANVERPLRESSSMAGRVLGGSKTADFLFRLLKRTRHMGSLFMLQREMNEATTEALALLTSSASVAAAPCGEADTSTPGLEDESRRR